MRGNAPSLQPEAQTLADSLRAPIGLALTTASLLAGLLVLGDSALAGPPPSLDGFDAWARTGDPVLHAAALARLVALAIGGWTLLTTTIGVGLRLAGLARAVTVANRCSPAIVRRTLAKVGTATLVGALSVPGPLSMATAGAGNAPPTTIAVEVPTATMTWEPITELQPDEQPTPTSTPDLAPAPPALPLPMPSTTGVYPTSTTIDQTPPTIGHEVESETGSTVPQEPSSSAATPTPATIAPDAQGVRPAPPSGEHASTTGGRPPTPASSHGIEHDHELADALDAPLGGAAASGAVRTTTVRPGQHLWGIAADAIATRLGSDPPAQAIVGYWLELIDANEDRLVEPGNPDLIFPGQVLVLP